MSQNKFNIFDCFDVAGHVIPVAHQHNIMRMGDFKKGFRKDQDLNLIIIVFRFHINKQFK